MGLTVADLAARLAAADSKQPAGVLRTRGRQLQLEVAGEFAAAARVAAVPLQAGERGVVTLGDIATVTKTWRDPPTEMAYADGGRAVLIGVRTRRCNW